MLTLYMVEMDMPYPGRLPHWHAWYEEHVERLLTTMPGFLRAQRFRSIAPHPAPYLAIYELADETALTSPAYVGPKAAAAWAPFMNNWRRNLFCGIEPLNAVPSDGWLAVWDRVSKDAPPLGANYARLQPKGLDRTVLERGLLAGAGSQQPTPRQEAGWSLRVFSPISLLKVAPGLPS